MEIDTTCKTCFHSHNGRNGLICSDGRCFTTTDDEATCPHWASKEKYHITLEMAKLVMQSKGDLIK